MPIAQIFLSPDAADRLSSCAETLTGDVTKILLAHLKPAPHTIQVMLARTLARPQGCEVLCIVQHRASPERNEAVRNAAATALHDILHEHSGLSIRVRLIALPGDVIAAKDTPGGDTGGSE